MTQVVPVPSSFRDPSGFVFFFKGDIYRQVNNSYKENYKKLFESGLYNELTDQSLMIPFEEVSAESLDKNCSDIHKIIKPVMIPFVSYPYEWSFTQMKDAALLTLEVQKKSIEKGMSLKDCSAYNIQFLNGKPIFIDNLSFEEYKEGMPWVAYKQFCQHFLSPLALASHVDIRLFALLKSNIDGIPLDLTSKLLPKKTWLNFSLFSNIHLHAKQQIKHADLGRSTEKSIKEDLNSNKVSKLALLGIIDSLENAIKKMEWISPDTEWGEYYKDTNYEKSSHNKKANLVSRFIDTVKPKHVWDLGSNDGLFSRISSEKGIRTVSFDIDPVAVENNYIKARKNNETKMLPLIMDLTNPSSGTGWNNDERDSLTTRGPADLAMALALIHHIAISNNIPLEKIGSYLASLCSNLIIEFVPKSDSQVKRLLATRDDIFPNYTEKGFEVAFNNFFDLKEKEKIEESERTLYLMSRKK